MGSDTDLKKEKKGKNAGLISSFIFTRNELYSFIMSKILFRSHVKVFYKIYTIQWRKGTEECWEILEVFMKFIHRLLREDSSKISCWYYLTFVFNAGNCAAKSRQWITKAYGKGKIGASMCGKCSVKLRKYFETKGKELLERLQNLKTDELAEYLKKDTEHVNLQNHYKSQLVWKMHWNLKDFCLNQ